MLNSFFYFVKCKLSFLGLFSITKRKALLGLVLGAASFFICVVHCRSPRDGIVMAFLFVILGMFRIDLQDTMSHHKLLYSALLRLLYALIALFAVCNFSLGVIDTTIPSTLGIRELLLNYLFAFILFVFSLVFTGNLTVSLAFSVLFMMGISTVNGFVFLFRGKELSAMDILSVRTAANVAGQYSYNFPPHVTLFWLRSFLIIFAMFSLPSPEKPHSLRKRALYLVTAVLGSVILIAFSRDIGVKTWEFQGSQFNGFYLNFYLGIRDSFDLLPENYKYENVDNMASQYEVPSNQASELPNIIVLMNESFSDFGIYENVPDTNIDVAPFISSLKENTVKGHALASVFAGNTANSEFEFLTGHTMAFFPNPTNSVPYQQYIKETIYCLPLLMNSLGYESFATHPYVADGWSRDVQYPRFGFSDSAFIEDYFEPEYIRSYVSDEAMYKYILEYIAARQNDKPLFLFGITMQNHSSYDTPDYIDTVEIDSSFGNYPLATQYLSLIKESDKALEFLIGELKNYPEDTVVLFFGDHMPKIEDAFYTELNGGPMKTLDEQMLKYTVPFFIWANYDIEEYTLEQTSLNYLAGHLLDVAGIELPPYYQFLRDTEEIIPAINAYGYYSKDQGRMIPLDEAEGEEAEALKRYSFVQYNNMFDSKNRNERFFSQYINAD